MREDNLKRKVTYRINFMIIDYSNKKKVFGLFYKFAQSIASIILWIYFFVSTYFARIFSLFFFVFNVINQDFRGKKPKVLRNNIL